MFQDRSFLLMNKDRALLEFEVIAGVPDEFITKRVFCPQRSLPYGFVDVHDWLATRRAPRTRPHAVQLLHMCGCDTLEDYLHTSFALSLNDTFWAKPSSSPLAWRDVSLYANAFDETIALSAFDGVIRPVGTPSRSPEYSTAGSYAKCWRRVKDTVYLLKSGSRNGGSGMEPYSEALAAQLSEALFGSALDYTVTHCRDLVLGCMMPASLCALFTSEDLGFTPAFKLLGKQEPSVIDFFELYRCFGSEDTFRRMLVLDALTLNTERRPGDHGLLFDTDTLQAWGMAPVFGNSRAFCPHLDTRQLMDDAQLGALMRPSIGTDFNLIAHQMLTPELARTVRELEGFRFDRSRLQGFPNDRIDLIERIVSRQARAVIEGTPFNRPMRPAMPPRPRTEQRPGTLADDPLPVNARLPKAWQARRRPYFEG